ncbi:hypothetical protein N5P37_011055 [Trichoderma harzianum]|nr:hypothetical protein N5P37_011055 [Trichoderma harzianum]PKK47726.1 hypothetical protein CI102_7113 [Trichoderma harzianum]
MSEPGVYDVYIIDEGNDGTAFHTRNEKGKKFRRILQQTPNGSDLHLTAKIRIEDIVHGTLSDGSQGALIILGFWFATYKQRHRFKRVRLQFHFQDVEMPGKNDPRVVSMYPEGICYLYETTSTKNVTTRGEISGRIQAPASAPIDGSVGYSIETSERVEEKYGVLFTGMPRIHKEYGDDEDAVVWTLEESQDSSQRRGVPANLQTAIVLGLPSDGPFSMTLEVECEPDTQTQLKTKLLGRRIIEDIDPVQIQSDTQQLRAGNRPGDRLSLQERETLDLVALNQFGFIKREIRVDATSI